MFFIRVQLQNRWHRLLAVTVITQTLGTLALQWFLILVQTLTPVTQKIEAALFKENYFSFVTLISTFDFLPLTLLTSASMEMAP